MSSIRFVAYVRTNRPDKGSQLFIDLFKSLPQNEQSMIHIVDFDQLKQTTRDPLPQWLKGAPTMCTHEENPTVWQGSKVLLMMENWIKSIQTRSQHQETRDTDHLVQQGKTTYASHEHNPAEKSLNTIAQDTDNSTCGRGAVMVSEDLYNGKMRSPASSGKITSADIAAYEQQRSSSQAVQRRERMAGY